MKFELSKSVAILSKTPTVLKTLLGGLPKEWTHQHEGEDTWSPFDVVGHLIHGEQTDWLVRTKIILSDQTDKTFESFDRFAQFEKSKGKTLAQLLDEFEMLRKENLRELKSLEISEADLDLEGTHPELGKATLRTLLASWVVHDLGHIAQISRVMATQYTSEVGVWSAYLKVLK